MRYRCKIPDRTHRRFALSGKGHGWQGNAENSPVIAKIKISFRSEIEIPGGFDLKGVSNMR